MNCRIILFLRVTMILANANFSLSLFMPFNAIRTNHQRRGQSHRKLVYPGLSEQWLSQSANFLFDKVKSHWDVGQKKDIITPLPDNPETRMTSVKRISDQTFLTVHQFQCKRIFLGFLWHCTKTADEDSGLGKKNNVFF